jgi:hypothetical protein
VGYAQSDELKGVKTPFKAAKDAMWCDFEV